MPSHAITRRQLLASGASATTALLLGRFAAAAGTLTAASADIPTFYDPRFPISRTLAGALPGASQLQAVQGDPSLLLTQLVAGSTGRQGKRLQGVTTESVPFCLEQMARRHQEVRFDSQRLDRDLFAWSLEMDPRPSAS
jgi:hypothetical protein